jgi:LysR family transcriptional regulator, benzoate and cis,cis-muconate-responsive activator of ben and cat genes
VNIDKLRMFVAVAENLNFTKAADSMYISQPTLSRHIADLERILGAALLERNTRSVSLTPLGKQFLIEARQIVNKYDTLMDRITGLASGLSGSLTVGYLEEFTQNILPEAIKTFQKRCPLVEFHLKDLNLLETKEAISNGDIDMGFVISHTEPQKDSTLQSISVVRGEVELVVGKDHPLACYDIISPLALEKEKIITFDAVQTPELRESITKMCVQYGFLPNFIEGDHSPGAIFLLVQAGLGVTILSSLVTSVLRTDKAFHAIKLDGVQIPTILELCWKSDNTNPCIANFVEEVQKAVNPKVLGLKAGEH